MWPFLILAFLGVPAAAVGGVLVYKGVQLDKKREQEASDRQKDTSAAAPAPSKIDAVFRKLVKKEPLPLASGLYAPQFEIKDKAALKKLTPKELQQLMNKAFTDQDKIIFFLHCLSQQTGTGSVLGATDKQHDNCHAMMFLMFGVKRYGGGWPTVSIDRQNRMFDFQLKDDGSNFDELYRLYNRKFGWKVEYKDFREGEIKGETDIVAALSRVLAFVAATIGGMATLGLAPSATTALLAVAKVGGVGGAIAVEELS